MSYFSIARPRRRALYLGTSPVKLVTLLLFAAAGLVGPFGAWADSDLAVTEYTSAPGNTAIPNAGSVTFSIRVNNLGPDTVSDAELTIAIATLTEVSAAPAGCVLTGTFPAAQSLVCTLESLADGESTITSYTGIARSTGTAGTTASVASAAVNDPVNGNDSETLTLTVIPAGDLTVPKVASVASAPAGSSITYTLSPNNAGPDDHTQVTVVDSLPPATEFAFASATGVNWSCSEASATVTCTYTGAAVTGDLGDIVIAGQIVSTTVGTITNIANIASTNPVILDPDNDNDSSGPVIVAVTAGTDLVAGKSMPATIVTGDSADVTLQLTNSGPMDIPAGATIVDTF